MDSYQSRSRSRSRMYYGEEAGANRDSRVESGQALAAGSCCYLPLACSCLLHLSKLSHGLAPGAPSRTESHVHVRTGTTYTCNAIIAMAQYCRGAASALKNL